MRSARLTQKRHRPNGTRSSVPTKYGFLSDADIDGCIDHDRPRELAPKPGLIYFAFIDASGGGPDAYSIAIGHKEGDRIIIDVVRGKHGTPHKTTRDFAELCRAYRVKGVTGDKYAKQWVQDAWRAEDFKYVEAEQPAAQLYLEAAEVGSRPRRHRQ